MVNLVQYPRQTIALSRKNFLLFFRRPLRILIRAFLVPVIIALVLALLKKAGISRDDNAGMGSAQAVRSLGNAMGSDGSKLVFVRDSNMQKSADSIIDKVTQTAKLSSSRIVKLDSLKELSSTCRQTLSGTSDCFAAVVFNTFSLDSNVNYTIVIDSEVQGRRMNWRSHDSALENRVLPIQWALDSAIGNFEGAEIPDEIPFGGGINLSQLNIPGLAGNGNVYYLLISLFVAPFFFLVFVDVVIYTCAFIARERENGTTELLTAQGCRKLPQIASSFISFWILYLPAFIACGLIFGLVLFDKTNAGLLVFMQILAGTSILAVCMLLATFFRRGNFAGPVSAVITVALACVSLAYLLNFTNLSAQGAPVLALSIVFPPFTYAIMIADIARLQAFNNVGFSLSRSSRIIIPDSGELSGFVQFPSFAPGLYPVFFLLQTALYISLALLAHRLLWYVPDMSKYLDPNEGLALRITGLSKTYGRKRAVDNLSFEVKRGAVVCLLGPNGGGKTTTLKCIAGMHTVDRGSLMELSCRPTELGICPQNNVHWGELTVREHIALWTDIKGGAQGGDTVESIIQECDLVEKADERVGTLSGGQKRKVQLAISFVGGSKICCIDEASSGLDPLSRQNVWSIIQKGFSRRTIIMTTHFLDEADILSDHVVIISKGKLVVEGPSTTLKSRHGDKYVISDVNNPAAEKHEASSSAEAHNVIAQLEQDASGPEKYEVAFPTLEQVFLKVANGDSLDGSHAHAEDAYAIRNNGGDEQQSAAALSSSLDHGRPLNYFQQVWALFVKRYVVLKHNWLAVVLALGIPIAISAATRNGISRTVYTSQNNCAALRQTFIDNGGVSKVYSGTFDNFADSLPGGFGGYSDFNMRKRSLDAETEMSSYETFEPTQEYYHALEKRSPEGSGRLYKRDVSDIIWSLTGGSFGSGQKLLIVGPSNAVNTEAYFAAYNASLQPIIRAQTQVYNGFLNTPETASLAATMFRKEVNSIDEMKAALNNRSSDDPWRAATLGPQLGIFTPNSGKATISFSLNNDVKTQPDIGMIAMNLVTNLQSGKKSGPTIYAQAGKFNKPLAKTSFLAIPFSTFLAMGFVLAFSTSIIYPAYERNRRVRALHYSNGVSPLALWSAYLLFELQIIFIVSFVCYGLISAGKYSQTWFHSTYLIGAIILFGIATCFGCYILSLYFGSRAAYPMSVVIHLILLLLFVVANILSNVTAPAADSFDMRARIQAGFGLISPGANLARAFFIATNAWSTLCGKYGENPPAPFSYGLYGGVYLNLIVQILFLSLVLVAFEYRWFGRVWDLRYAFGSKKRASSGPYEKSSTRANSDIELVANNSGYASGRAHKESMAADSFLRASHLTKRFGKNIAVDDVSLGISPNVTLALLGPNGAGKTTTINMIRGELRPDQGDVFIRDVSITKSLIQARSQIGVCPQDDAVDDMTVRQTLRFYASIKGVPNIDRNVDTVIGALRIQEFRDRRVSKLSGGTKRKLSVAISLLGNPPVLLLDEPSTGQDAASKRALWKTLRGVANDRAILLTTHSMEEVEALASSVAIISTRMLANGTTTELRERYGGFYHVRAVVADGEFMDHESSVRMAFEGAGVREFSSNHNQVKFSVPQREMSFATVMERMEMMKKNGGLVKEYTVNGATLEEVFLNVCGAQGRRA